MYTICACIRVYRYVHECMSVYTLLLRRYYTIIYKLLSGRVRSRLYPPRLPRLRYLPPDYYTIYITCMCIGSAGLSKAGLELGSYCKYWLYCIYYVGVASVMYMCR